MGDQSLPIRGHYHLPSVVLLGTPVFVNIVTNPTPTPYSWCLSASLGGDRGPGAAVGAYVYPQGEIALSHYNC